MTFKKIRRLGIAVLALAMAAQFCVPAFAESDSGGEADFSAIFQKEEITPTGLRANDQVRIVVELEDAPLLANTRALQAYKTASDYLTSSQAKSREKTLSTRREQVIRSLNRSGMDLQVKQEYSAVFNGFAVTAAYGDLEAIQNTDGVKDAFVAECHALVEPLEADAKLADSTPMIGGDIVSGNGYTGKGTVVAILDTGLEIDHEAFQGQVNNPKYDKSDINDLIQNNSMTIGKLSANAVYHSSKIPFAFDYRGHDTGVSGHYHGTHVAGIVGANSGDTVTGVAPDAQFLIMKVFDDEGTGAYDDDILSALDDAVKLGADAINMSLGSTAGFSTAATKSMNAVYQRVKDAGINLLCAAGNEYSSTYHGASGNDLPLTTNPDNGTVGSPSTYGAALSVASVNNAKSTASYFLVGQTKVQYNDSAENAGEAKFTSLSGSFAYVDCGYGGSADCTAAVKGKIALIQRGGEENGEILTFQQKEANALAAGAKAAIIYDNVDGASVSISTDHKIPCVFISKADGEMMLAQTDKTLEASPDYIGQFADSYSGKMSDFSSWGVTPDLKLKPEITAPGGNIYSTMKNNSYGSLSGTSMAAPHLAGAAAIMDQYVNEKLDGLNMTNPERSALVEDLLMSTAIPVRDEKGNDYSPRKQGAGLIQLDKATTAKAYLTGADGGRPKAENGDSTQGQWSFAFQLKRLQGTGSIPYTVSASVLTEAVVTENGKNYIAQQSRALAAEEYTLTAPATVTLTQDSQTVNISLTLTEKGKQNLSRDFPNGIFVEGFITLTPTGGGETVALSLPFMGFYGDWSKAPLFDATAYSGEEPNVTDMWLGAFDNRTGGGYQLGTPLYGSAYSFFDADKIAINGDTSQNVTAVCALLRNADTLTFSVTDSEDALVYTETTKQANKSYYYNNQTFYTPMAKKGFIPVDEWNAPLPDGSYTYTVSGQVAGKTQSISFPLTIDNEKPQVIRSEISGSTWKVTVKDNHYVQAVGATVGETPLTGWINPRESTPGAETTVEFDLSDAAFTGLTQAKIAIADYAYNQFVSDWYSLKGATVVQPTAVQLDREQLLLPEGTQASLQATVLPENASNRTVTWKSSDTTVAAVDAAGLVTAKKAGTAKITATTTNGLTAVCQVTVTAAEQGKALASLSAPRYAVTGTEVPFAFQMEQMTGVATVSFTFERDAGLTGGTVTGKNGFTSLGVQWEGNRGVMVLSYLGRGAGGTLTRSQLTDLAELSLKAETEKGNLGVKLVDVAVCGYDASGKAIYLDSGIKTDRAEVAVGPAVNYDLNGDGVVDLLDITYCQTYYRATTSDSNWSQAKRCDLDGSGTVDIQDMILILRNFT